MASCIDCGEELNHDELRPCIAGCDKFTCVGCNNSCEKCNMPCCSKCWNECEECGLIACPDCLAHGEGCDKCSQ